MIGVRTLPLLLLASGCAAAPRADLAERPPPPAATAADRTGPAADAAPATGPVAITPVERTAAALYRGDRALAAGDGADLAAAATTLAALGAHPLDDAAPALDAAWWGEARRLGQGDSQAPYRGRVLGPAYRRASLAPGELSTSEQSFLSGQRAEIAIVPAAGADLALAVTDAAGKDVCRRPVGAPRTVCRWHPVFTARYRIAVANTGTRAGGFYLVTN